MELMSMIEKAKTYYTPEQLKTLRERAQSLGEEHIHKVEAEWPELIAEVRAEMERGTDPGSETMQALARRWKELVDEFTGGDPGIASSLRTMYQNEPAAREQSGIDPEMFAYIGRTLALTSGE
jgi:hypothetical protein